jgi:hypothetical protein
MNWTITVANVAASLNECGNVEIYGAADNTVVLTPEELETISEWVRFVREKKL